MKKKSVGVVLIILAIAFAIGSVGSAVLGVMPLIKSFKSLGSVEAPGKLIATLEEAGTYCIWHEHSGMIDGVTFSHKAKLPSGFKFEVKDEAGNILELAPYSGATMSSGSSEKASVGTFKVDAPGTYTIDIETPDNLTRVFTVTKGEMLQQIGLLIIGIVICSLASLLAFVMLVLGIVCLVHKPKEIPVSV